MVPSQHPPWSQPLGWGRSLGHSKGLTATGTPRAHSELDPPGSPSVGFGRRNWRRLSCRWLIYCWEEWLIRSSAQHMCQKTHSKTWSRSVLGAPPLPAPFSAVIELLSESQPETQPSSTASPKSSTSAADGPRFKYLPAAFPAFFLLLSYASGQLVLPLCSAGASMLGGFTGARLEWAQGCTNSGQSRANSTWRAPAEPPSFHCTK